MANTKISALTAATTPLAGTEVLPIVQSSATVKVATNDLTVRNIRAAATTGILQISGPSAASTRTATVPDANFTVARTDAAQTFTGTQTFASDLIRSGGPQLGLGGGSVTTNTALGYQSLLNNTTGLNNVCSGYTAGLNNTVGYDNTFIGFSAGYSNQGGYQNTAVGGHWPGAFGSTLQSNVSGFSNSAFGISALVACTGNQNTGIGTYAGGTATSGANNGFFGYNAQPSAITISNEYTYGDSNVTAHRYYGNLVPLGAAKGIDFSANTPLAGKTSTVLGWYEEGTWTPNQGAGLTLVGAFSSTGKYTRIGRQVSISGTVTGATSVAVTAAGVITSNLPFTVGTAGHGDATNAAVTASATVICTSTSVTSASAIAATGTITFSATYFV